MKETCQIPEQQKQKIMNPSSIVRIISGKEEVFIKELSGREYRSELKDIFKSSIGLGYENWKFSPSEPTKKTKTDIGEIFKDATFAQIFTDCNPNLDKLVFTEAQIVCFCKDNYSWLRQEGRSTFFLRKINGEYVVVRIYVLSDDCIYGIRYRLNASHYIWYGVDRHRVVFPVFEKSFIA